MDRASSSISIKAPVDRVLAVIGDFGDYPSWSSEVKSAEIIATDAQGRGTEVTFVVDAGVVQDTYTLAYDWSAPGRLSWRLLEAQMQKAQEGAYTLHADGDSTKVIYELAVDLAIPMLGLLKRKAEKMIINTALKGLKARVEQP